MMSHSQNVAHKNANSEKEFMVFPEITPEASLSRHLDKNSFVPCILLGNNRKPGEEDQIPSSSGPSSSGTFKRLAHEEIPKSKNAKKAKIVLLREEFIDLTQDPLIAMVLNQLFYWSQRVNDFGLFLEEEIESSSKINQSAHYGWFYKSAQELVEETMLRVSKVTLLRRDGFLRERILSTNGTGSPNIGLISGYYKEIFKNLDGISQGFQEVRFLAFKSVPLKKQEKNFKKRR